MITGAGPRPTRDRHVPHSLLQLLSKYQRLRASRRVCRSMAESIHPHHPHPNGGHEDPGHLNNQIFPTRQQRFHDQPDDLGWRCPTPPTDLQLRTLRPVSTATLAAHRLGCSHLFHLQEREFFSRRKIFRIVIDIDLPGETRAKGDPTLPPLPIKDKRKPEEAQQAFTHNASSQSWHRSPSGHPRTQSQRQPPRPQRLQTTPLSVATGSTDDNRIRSERQSRRHNPYPPSKRNGSPQVVNNNPPPCCEPNSDQESARGQQGDDGTMESW